MRTNKKHREFFMNKYTMECRFEKVNDDDIHVIEYAAFEHAATKCEEAQSELLSCRKEVEAMKAKLQIAVDALKKIRDYNSGHPYAYCVGFLQEEARSDIKKIEGEK